MYQCQKTGLILFGLKRKGGRCWCCNGRTRKVVFVKPGLIQAQENRAFKAR